MRKITRNILQTFSGRVIDLDNPRTTSIKVIDICEGLSKVCRFSGQVSEFYSVAAHSLHVARLIHESGGTREEVLYGLLHDASEAYIADLPSPIKRKLPGYHLYEKKLQSAIYERFGLDPRNVPEIVKWADDECLELERQCLFAPGKGIDLGGNTMLQLELYMAIRDHSYIKPSKEQDRWLHSCLTKYAESLPDSIKMSPTTLGTCSLSPRKLLSKWLTILKEQCINIVSNPTPKQPK